jgi:predicted GNAT family acetyltransferase
MRARDEIIVQENAAASRYDASTDAGVIAGFTEYDDRDGVRVFTHTEVDDAYEGHGVGAALVRGALDDVRARGMAVRTTCPFVEGYLDEHPEYADLRAG